MLTTPLTIKRVQGIDGIDSRLASFLMAHSEVVAHMYGCKFNPRNFDFAGYARTGLFLVARRGPEPVGVLLARLFDSIFDSHVRILFQDLLYVKDGGPRAAYALMQDFIDFGKSHANHIITCVAPRTNIKGNSLEKLGFHKLETLYRMEV